MHGDRREVEEERLASVLLFQPCDRLRREHGHHVLVHAMRRVQAQERPVVEIVASVP